MDLLFADHQYREILPNRECKYWSFYSVWSDKYNTRFSAKVLELDGKNDDFKNQLYKREVDALTKLQHRNIVDIYDYFTSDRFLVIVLTYLSEGTLEDYIKNKSELLENNIHKFVTQITAALEHCHKHGIAHGQICPSNIAIIKGTVAKLFDFGMATINQEEPLTCFPEIDDFTPPEIVQKIPYNPFKVDIWQYGVTIFQLTNFSLPFTGENQKELGENICNGEFSLKKEINANILYAINTTLEKNPKMRTEMSDLLGIFVETKPGAKKTSRRLSYGKGKPTGKTYCCYTGRHPIL